jgi:hypothetical protein
MNKYKLLTILIILAVFFVIYLVLANITFDSKTEVVYPSTSPEQRISIFESELEKALKLGEKILFRGGDISFIQFSISKDKHLIMMIPLSVSIAYAKPVTWAKFFIETRYHKIALSAEQETRLREISELRDAPVKITSKKRPSPERFIETDLGTDVKRASEIVEEVFIEVFQTEQEYKVTHTFADFRNIQW